MVAIIIFITLNYLNIKNKVGLCYNIVLHHLVSVLMFLNAVLKQTGPKLLSVH